MSGYTELGKKLRYEATWREDFPEDKELLLAAADAIEHLTKAVANYAEQACENETKWIPVTERLPDESFKNVLCCGARGGMFVGWVATKPEHGKITAFVHGGNGRYITHWMPLPEPPKEGET